MQPPEFFIKICGITSETDARAAIEAGATSLGLNAWPQSKRYLSLPQSAQWVAQLAPQLPHGFGVVLVNPSLDEALQAAIPGVRFLQLHGEESPDFIAELQQRLPADVSLIKALRVRDERTIRAISLFPGIQTFLLDAFCPSDYGGTGKTFDWNLARQALRDFPEKHLILSGGLTPETVHNAVKTLLPAGVDVASGVEDVKNSRKKDPAKMRAFVDNATSALSASH